MNDPYCGAAWGVVAIVVTAIGFYGFLYKCLTRVLRK